MERKVGYKERNDDFWGVFFFFSSPFPMVKRIGAGVPHQRCVKGHRYISGSVI
jgi:hypothetical protein